MIDGTTVLIGAHDVLDAVTEAESAVHGNAELSDGNVRRALEAREEDITSKMLFKTGDLRLLLMSLKKGARLKYFEVKKLEQIDGIWVATEMTMATRKGEETLHRTVLSAKNVRFGQPLKPDFFTVRQLEKGLP